MQLVRLETSSYTFTSGTEDSFHKHLLTEKRHCTSPIFLGPRNELRYYENVETVKKKDGVWFWNPVQR